jgi:hypothetical protein
MKKLLQYLYMLMILVLGGCVSIPVGSGVDLDTAVRQAAAQMNAKLPAGTTVALVSVASPSAAFSEQVLLRLESALVSGGKLVVVDRSNLDKIRAEQGFQLSGEVDDESAKSIGKLLGAGAIVTGSTADLGDAYSLALKTITIETGTVVVSYLADLSKTERVQALMASGGGASSSGAYGGSAATSGGSKAPAQTALPGPADGTYTFKPRLQAFQGARAVAVYLDKVVVRRGYLTIYIYDTVTGNGTGYGSYLVGEWKSASLKDMANNRYAKLVEVIPKGPPYGEVAEYNISFQNVSGTRFTLASADKPAIEFYDFELSEPD